MTRAIAIAAGAVLSGALLAVTQDEAQDALSGAREASERLRGTLGDSHNLDALDVLLEALQGYVDPPIVVEPPDPPDPPVEPPPDTVVPVIYSRVRRTTEIVTIDVNGQPVEITRPDIYDALPEVGKIYEKFSAPGQLVLHTGDGEVVLYDCTEPCVPLDAVVSYDGTEALFSVYRGSGYQSSWHASPEVPNQLLAGPIEAQLHRVSLIPPYEVTPLDHTPGVFDTGPVYLPQGGIMYTSTQGAGYPPVLRRQAPGQDKVPRLWIRDPEPRLVGEADMSGSLHPFVTTDGRVAVSQLMQNHLHAYRATNGSFNWPGTLDNLWWVVGVDQGGGHWESLYGAHRYGSALHFIGQLSDGWMMVAHYYRANNFGGGEILMWLPEQVDIEGRGMLEPGEFLAPRTLTKLAPWSSPQDNWPRIQPTGPQAGEYFPKLRDPSGLPGGAAMVTLLRGFCNVIGAARSTLATFDTRVADQPRGCDAGLYRTTQIPSESPADLEVIVDSPDWHEFQARAAVAYRDIYDQSTPAEYRYEDEGTCQLRMASMESETTPKKPYHFGHVQACGMQGCELDGVTDEDVKAIRFWRAIPNTERARDFNSLDHSWGFRNTFLGDVPVMADGSAYADVPCETPYVMAGLDAEGRVIKRDQVTQVLRQGERRECSGCHLHSKPGPSFEGTIAAGLPPTVLTGDTPVPEWGADVKPYLEANCMECHETDPWLWNYDALVWDFKQATAPNPTPVNDREDSKRFYIQRPNTSRWVSSDFARSSLLYWKCLGYRADNHIDEQYLDDIDFGAEHPGFDGCSLIADWIDSGAYRSK